MKNWLESEFGDKKPVIAMVHFPALPGTPRYNRSKGLQGIKKSIQYDLNILNDEGVDAVLFCNEDDRPYSLVADLEATSVMSALISEVKPISLPFGVDFLWDAKAAIAIAKATGASFIREVVTGTYESDMGLWAPNAAEIFRYRTSIDASDIGILANITPEFASTLGSRSIALRAKSAVTSSLVDAILISGPRAGAEPNIEGLLEAKNSVGSAVPIILNTGAKAENITRFLEVADGVIVGSSLKIDGKTWNPIDPKRVSKFMKTVSKVNT